MPLFKVETNKKIDQDEVNRLMDTFAELISDQIRATPKEFVMVIINQNVNFLFRGSTEPAAYCTLKVKGLNKWKKSVDLERLDITISAHVKVLLDLPDNRVFVEVFDMDRKGVFSYFDGLY